MQDILKVASYSYMIEFLCDDEFNSKFIYVHSGIENIESVCKFSDGFIDYSKQILYLRDSLHKDAKATCIVSLIIELMANSSGIDSLSGIAINNITQIIMAMMSPHLLQVLRDNEQLLKRLNIIGCDTLP